MTGEPTGIVVIKSDCFLTMVTPGWENSGFSFSLLFVSFLLRLL